MTPMRESDRLVSPSKCGSSKTSRTAGTIAFFAHDSTESTVIKRAKAFEACGFTVLGLMFKRTRSGPSRHPTWRNVDLGITVDRNYLLRLPKLLVAIGRVLMRRHDLRQCGIFYARNIDMLFIAVVSCGLLRIKPVVAYEVLDVQRVFIGNQIVNRLFRWAERRLLTACSWLVVSSPEFISNYYAPVQAFRGSWFLLENKVPASRAPACATWEPTGLPPPWIIGWFGTLRCAKSLQVLCRVADTMGDRVRVHIRGRVSEEDLPIATLSSEIAGRPNIIFGGAYESPDDLPTIYQNIHFSWSVDYLDAGTNSDWLLPNRIYEGCLYGALALARSDTATGRMVAQKGLGWQLEEPLQHSTIALLKALDQEAYTAARNALANVPRSVFVDEDDTCHLLRNLCKGSDTHSAAESLAQEAAQRRA